MESILAQTYDDLEIILVDDGSSDSSGRICDEYACRDLRIQVIHQKNKGVSAARIEGLKMASGEWVSFIDSDDIMEKDMYEFLLGNAEKYNADISHCGYQMVFADGRVNYFYNTGRLVKQDREAGLKDLLSGSFIEPGLCNKLFRNTLFHSLLHDSLMPEDIKINEDLLMNYFLFSNSKLSVFEDVCKYHYIVRNSSALRVNNVHRIYDPIRVKQIILEHSDEGLKPYAKRAYIDTCLNVYNSLAAEKGNEFEHDKEKVRKLLTDEKSDFGLLSPKRRLLANFAAVVPRLHRAIYGYYVKHIQVNRYE